MHRIAIALSTVVTLGCQAYPEDDPAADAVGEVPPLFEGYSPSFAPAASELLRWSGELGEFPAEIYPVWFDRTERETIRRVARQVNSVMATLCEPFLAEDTPPTDLELEAAFTEEDVRALVEAPVDVRPDAETIRVLTTYPDGVVEGAAPFFFVRVDTTPEGEPSADPDLEYHECSSRAVGLTVSGFVNRDGSCYTGLIAVESVIYLQWADDELVIWHELVHFLGAGFVHGSVRDSDTVSCLAPNAVFLPNRSWVGETPRYAQAAMMMCRHRWNHAHRDEPVLVRRGGCPVPRHDAVPILCAD